jgi:hypothetical protein
MKSIIIFAVFIMVFTRFNYALNCSQCIPSEENNDCNLVGPDPTECNDSQDNQVIIIYISLIIIIKFFLSVQH